MIFPWLSSKRNLPDSGLLSGMTDVHCHLLPGVDDGMRSKKESMEALRFLIDLGVRRMFLTPHIMSDLQENTLSCLRERFEAFVEDYPGEITLKLAGEYMLDSGFPRQREMGLLTYADNHVLVETSYMAAPANFWEVLSELLLDGYTPVLAHPERYRYMLESDYLLLHERGCKLQLNLLSLSGCYGSRAVHNAKYMLESGLYSYIGSDFHNIEFHKNVMMQSYLSKKLRDALKPLFENNHSLWT